MSDKKDSPSAYNDVKFVMDMALEKPGLRYELQTHGRAINFKQRCNRYRNLMRQMAQEVANIPGRRAETLYDVLVIRQTDRSGVSNTKGNTLVFDHQAVEGKLIDPETNEEIEINLPGITDTIVDDWEPEND